MKEVGIPLEGQYPKIYTKEMTDKVYIVITMGYLDRCPYARRRRRGTGTLEDLMGNQ